MHYYILYYRKDNSVGIKHYDENDKNKIGAFINKKKDKGCTGFIVKKSEVPPYVKFDTQGVMPYLTVSDEEQFENLKGEEIPIEEFLGTPNKNVKCSWLKQLLSIFGIR